MDCTKIETLIKANRAAIDRARKRLTTLHAESIRLDRELHRAKLADHIGGSVVTRCVGAYPDFDGKVGALVAVKRTRCVVTFDWKRWSLPIQDVLRLQDAEYRGSVLVGGGQ